MAEAAVVKDNTKRQLPKRVPPLTVSRAFGQKSPLVDADLQAFLTRCLSADNWLDYTDTERTRMIECLPRSKRPNYCAGQNNSSGAANSDRPTTTDTALTQTVPADVVSQLPMDPSNVATDSYIKRAIARFKRDLGDGYYEKTWQDKARRAHQERMDGKLDEYVREHAETMFEDDDSLGNGNDDERDELAQVSEDGEYIGTSRKGGRGKGRPRKPK